VALPFTKMQGAGNDFVVVDGEPPRDWPAVARALCARHVGVGADGLLVALPAEDAHLRMRMFNPDGSEDDCGNGLRCLALYARLRRLAPADEFVIRTLSGLKRVWVHGDHPAPEAAAEVTADLGRALLTPADLPALAPDPPLDYVLDAGGESLTASTVFTGSTHTVVFETPEDARFHRLSPLIEQHPAFPERTSVLWAEVTGPETARVRIWERGVGETLACGTGAAAVAVVAHLTGRAGPSVAVSSRGGVLRVTVGPDLRLTQRGPAAVVFEGVWTAG
jgi:diaminopimelate epimerase